MSDLTDINQDVSSDGQVAAVLITTPADWGNVVRDHRRDLEMSQGAHAEAIGMSRQWVVRFENGHASTATVEHILRLVEALELDIQIAAP